MRSKNLHNRKARDKFKGIGDKIDISLMYSFNSESDYTHEIPLKRLQKANYCY